MRKKLTIEMIFVIFSILVLVLAATKAASAQSTAAADRTFESEGDGFRLQVPQGWVIQDKDIMTAPSDPNIETIAILCLENEALPGLGGAYNCDAANFTDITYINKFADLQSRPEFQNESVDDNTAAVIPTTDDLVALWIRELRNESASQIRIENTIDIDEFTKRVNMTYQFVDRAGTNLPFDDFTFGLKSTGMYVLSQDRDTGYNIVNNLPIPNFMNRTEHSPAVQEVFNSFEILEE